MLEENIKDPLVSIIVITYNSSKYVLETLESAKNQTYQNIELIVSDDCSTDNTVAMCKEWLEYNNERFVNSEVITVEKNTGIPSNCNRGLYMAKGEWIKFIAGDDALLDNCISDNLNRIKERHEKVYALHSDVYYYREYFNESNFICKSEKIKDIISHPYITPAEQLGMFVRKNVPLAPTVFFKKEALIFFNGFDEELPYEDIPMWIKFASNNMKIHFLNTVTVKYRLTDSFSNSKNDKFIFKTIYKSDKLVLEKLYIHYLSLLEIYCMKATFELNDIFIKYNLNIRTPLNLSIYKVLNCPFYMCWLLNIKLIEFKIRFRIYRIKR